MIAWILLLFVSSSQSVYYGSVMTYYPRKYAGPNGAHLVEVHSEMTTGNCSVIEWRCPCTLNSTVTKLVDTRSDGLCQTETTTVFQVSTDTPFQLRLDGGSQVWVDNSESRKLVRGLSVVDLRNRSDTDQANRPPQAAIMSPIRIPSNCARQMPLLVVDSDFDQVLCRFASVEPYECHPCSNLTLAPSLTLTPTCYLSWVPPTSPPEGLYVVDLVMEDYPRTDLTLTPSNGTQENKSTSDPISLVPLQFVLNLTSSIPSCTKGEFVPKFIDPTPEHGTQFHVNAGDKLQMVIQAKASAAKIEGLLFSGPENVTEEAKGSGLFVLTWTPSADVNGRSFPLCFVARAEVDSEIRCVILRYGISVSPLFSGGALAYYTSFTSGLVMVTFQLKTSVNCPMVPETIASINKDFFCASGNCGEPTLVGYFSVDGENSGSWCQTETVFTLKSPPVSPFVAYLGLLFIKVDLRIRSDTKRPNKPPIISGPLTVRVPQNCEREYKLLAFDEDGDEVRICASFNDNNNCTSCSNVTSYGTTFCTHRYKSSFYPDEYIKDFPRQNISLTDTSGSQEVKTPSDDISYYNIYRRPLVEEAAPSCTEGVYIPKFTSPTPEFGEILYALFGETLIIEVSAEANTSKVSELLFSGPHEMEKLIITEGQFQLLWTPSEEERGQTHPVCFLVEAVVGSRRFQTEPRCVLVRVGLTNTTVQPPTTAPPPDGNIPPTNTTAQSLTTEPLTMAPPPPDAQGDNYVVVLNAKLTSLSPHTDFGMEDFLTQFKSILVGQGLPPETTMKILNVTSSGENKP